MARINLLDWREARRERRKKQFGIWIAIAVLVAGAIVGSAWMMMNRAIEFQEGRNQLLKSEIKAVEQKIKEIEELERVKDNLLARMRVIESLQASRSATVHFFDEIVDTIPDGVYLTSIAEKGSTVTIKGVAESNGRVSTYMKNLEASPWFKTPRLVVIRAREADRVRQSEFELQIKTLDKPEKGSKGDDEDDLDEVLE